MNRVRAGSVLLPLTIIVALCALIAFPAQAAYAQDDEGQEPKLEINSAADIVGKRICMVAGAAFDQLLFSNYEGISQGDISYYNSNAEMIGALRANKADVMIADLPVA